MMELTETVGRLAAAAERLEQAMERMTERQVTLAAEAQESVGRIVATVESAREEELTQRLEAAEAKITSLLAAASATATAGRKTLSAGTTTMLAKSGVVLEHGGVAMEASAVDAALTSLSIEQRIAVKAELLRSGLLG